MEDNNQSQNQTQLQDDQAITGEVATADSSASGGAAGSTKAGQAAQNETAAAQGDELSKTTVIESRDDNEAISREVSRYKRPINESTAKTLNRAGLVFMGVSSAILVALTIILYRVSAAGALTAATPFKTDMEMLNYYLYHFSGPILLFLASLTAAGIGYALMRAAGTATKQVVNPEDMDLVELLLTNNKQSFIEDFVRLSSLAGFTGMFTKVGLYGLPLATIVLTIIFTLLAMSMPSNQQSLFDLAKLTLGAFIGSYVQRQSVETQAQDIRRQVTDVQNKMADVQTKLTNVQNNPG